MCRASVCMCLFVCACVCPFVCEHPSLCSCVQPSVFSPGADSIKKYWSRYYQGSQGVVFILDSASTDEDLEMARTELHSALQHPQLCTLPFLILANHQDKPAARTTQEVGRTHTQVHTHTNLLHTPNRKKQPMMHINAIDDGIIYM